MADPFRNELDAAHARIEKMETDHAARVGELEKENERLRRRLIDVAPSRTKTGRVFGALAMMILGVSLAGGLVFARLTRAPVPPIPHVAFEPIELPASTNEEADPGDFNREDVSRVLNAINIADCGGSTGPHGRGHVRIVFATNGDVITSTVDDARFAGTAAGQCVENRFRKAYAPSFTGAPRVVGKAFVIP